MLLFVLWYHDNDVQGQAGSDVDSRRTRRFHAVLNPWAGVSRRGLLSTWGQGKKKQTKMRKSVFFSNLTNEDPAYCCTRRITMQCHV